MGTELLRGGAAPPLESQSLTAPQRVAAVHAAYRRAGAEILTTNTFGANRYRLGAHGMAGRVRELNGAAARIARAAADGALVAGSVGPSGLQPDPPYSRDLRHAFGEQAAALDGSGIDLFWCETFGSLREIEAAIEGIRDVSPRPIVALMTYTAEGRTPLGETPGEVARSMAALPVAAIGVSCAIGESTVETVVRELRDSTGLPLVAQPNAGTPIEAGRGLRYPMDPAAFADLAQRVAPFVSLVAGCCGTTPAHIAAARSLRDRTRRTASWLDSCS